MSEIKRYDPMSFGPENAYLTEDATGDVVKYDDHVAVVAGKDAEIARLREALEHLTRSAGEVSRLGATVGNQWMKLSSALVRARAALQPTSGGEADV